MYWNKDNKTVNTCTLCYLKTSQKHKSFTEIPVTERLKTPAIVNATIYTSHVIQYPQVSCERDFFLIWKKLDNLLFPFVSSLKSVRDEVDPDVMELLLLFVEVGRDTELID